MSSYRTSITTAAVRLPFHANIAVLGAASASQPSIPRIWKHRFENPTKVGSYKRFQFAVCTVSPTKSN